MVVAGLEAGPVTASRGLGLLPETTLDAVLDQDFKVVLPGGLGGAERLEADRRITALLRRMTEQGRYVAAICAAPRVLAKAGLLNDREATAYPGILGWAGAGGADGTFIVTGPRHRAGFQLDPYRTAVRADSARCRGSGVAAILSWILLTAAAKFVLPT